MPSGFGCASGALVAAKSGNVVADPLAARGSDAGFRVRGIYERRIPPTQRFRSLHGLPFKSAEARLYITRRFAGHAQPT